MLKGSLGSVGNDSAETSNVNTSDHVKDHIVANDNLRGVDEVLSSNNENKSCHESSVDACIPDGVAGLSNGCNVLGKSFESRSPFQFTEAAPGDMNKENYSALRVEQHSNFEVLSCENVDSAPILSISTETLCDQDKESKSHKLTSYGDQEVIRIALSSVQEEMQIGISSDPSWKEQASVKKYEMRRQLIWQMKCVRKLPVKAVCLLYQIMIGTSALNILLTSDHNEVNSDAVTGIEEEKAQEASNEAYARNMISTTFESRDWDGLRGNQMGNSGNDFIIGFGRNNLQPDEDVMAGDLRKTGQENVLQGCLIATRSALV
ncbi:Hypothetical predicted protein [Olea europaea subsp. europaea]|uniref:Uncharacterized protein n=1 Tax=Olea europaea subsp. europaea TaxID=158383 RepID=A0A8S0RRE0_OLEEU|nr:Hypothetical predicted protein [Olea europaea subsp. europaea]